MDAAAADAGVLDAAAEVLGAERQSTALSCVVLRLVAEAWVRELSAGDCRPQVPSGVRTWAAQPPRAGRPRWTLSLLETCVANCRVLTLCVEAAMPPEVVFLVVQRRARQAVRLSQGRIPAALGIVAARAQFSA